MHKYSLINFILVILEFSDKENLIKKEQYLLDKYKPSYNVLKIAGSLKHYKHSVLTREKMSKSHLNKKLTESNKIKMSKARNTEEYKILRGHQVEVTDLLSNKVQLFLTKT